jgi:kynurenine 3-monooxygenase
LAISHRGIAALEAIEPAAAKQFLQSAIPMHGRMIHKLSGELDSQLYDRDGQVRETCNLFCFIDATLTGYTYFGLV